ncbi:MAG TPA: EscU/YscU/HrcU family type III secretion system export apparatus switch protein [Polyangiales bacterium]|nr:EscU/YscU/HrcU family type III secretion system export apparatus switch protein [Polyangiales bacterium]
MADDEEQRTEEATPRKRQKMHEEGQIPRSQDVGAAAVVIATCAALGYSFESLARALIAFTTRTFRLEDATRPLHAVHAQLDVLAPAFVPLLVASVAAAIAGIAQSRVFSFELLAPKPERFNPLPQLKQMLPGKDSMIEIGKQVLKLLAIGFIAYRVVRSALPQFSTLSAAAPLAAAEAVGKVAAKLTLHIAIAFVAAAALDYWLARRKFLHDAMMSRQEVRDEHKQEEGRPEVRQRMRARMREMSRNRGVADVAKATVLVVNPTHYAVALRYAPDKDFAPMIIAKGVDEMALAMRARARKERVPIVEQRTLARSLHAAKVGRPIPVELYRAVAEVIAYVMQLRARDAGLQLAQPPAAEGGEGGEA